MTHKVDICRRNDNVDFLIFTVYTLEKTLLGEQKDKPHIEKKFLQNTDLRKNLYSKYMQNSLNNKLNSPIKNAHRSEQTPHQR